MKTGLIRQARGSREQDSRPGVVGGRFAMFGFFKLEKLRQVCRKNRQGAAVVEFAVVCPVLFALTFGMIEYGRMVMAQQILTNAAREGARVAILTSATFTQVEDAVNNYLTAANITGATITCNPGDPSSAGYGDPVTVTVSVPFTQVSWLPAPLFLEGITLSATTVMRKESAS